ncbi:MAG: transposase [Akkermansia sp.]|nr:transposase [Akkermansia sp.]
MKDRASYSAEEKLAIVKMVLSRKHSIQDVAKEKGIAATLISLWKKQAEDAMTARFQPQPKGRRKVEKPVEVVTADAKSLKNDVRKAKIKAAHLEASLKESKKRVALLEQQLGELCAALGYKLVKVRNPRKGSKA